MNNHQFIPNYEMPSECRECGMTANAACHKK